MGAHKDIPVFSRLEIVETGRRRRWSDAEKLRIVEESDLGHRQVSATARRNGISRTLLMSWRRARGEGRLGFDAVPSFTPLVVATAATPAAAPAKRRRRGGRIEVELGNGRRITIEPDIDPEALARLADALDRR
jgi:transposase